MYQQVLDPLAGSLGWSALAAAMPLLTMFLALGVARRSAHLSGALTLVVAVAVAVAGFRMGLPLALDVALYGAAFSVLAVLWIPINAIWLHNVMVDSGYFAVLRRAFAGVGDDLRVQALLIAFCFGTLMEALAGGGVPIAIAVSMLVALGMSPLRAVVVALLADTAPVAFGGLAVPVTTLATVTELDFDRLGAIIGRQTPVVGLLVPLLLVALVDGRRGLRQTWPAALVAGVTFAAAQFATSNYLSVPLADIVAALVGAGALLLFLRVWTPAELVRGDPPPDAGTPEPGTPEPAGGPTGRALPVLDRTRGPDTRRDVLLAFSPYLVVVVVFVLAQLPPVKAALSALTVTVTWPGVDVVDPAGEPLTDSLALNVGSATGTLLLLAGIITVALLRVPAGAALRRYGATLVELRWLIVTVLTVLAVAWVMNYSGQTATLGLFLAGTGAFFAFLSPAIGWLGVAITGSDNSANALFGALQVKSAAATGLPPDLLAAANSSGGVLGKPISPQSLAIGSAAAGMVGQEGRIFRRTLPYAVGLLLVMCVLVFLQATPVLGWMIP